MRMASPGFAVAGPYLSAPGHIIPLPETVDTVWVPLECLLGGLNHEKDAYSILMLTYASKFCGVQLLPKKRFTRLLKIEGAVLQNVLASEGPGDPERTLHAR